MTRCGGTSLSLKFSLLKQDSEVARCGGTVIYPWMDAPCWNSPGNMAWTGSSAKAWWLTSESKSFSFKLTSRSCETSTVRHRFSCELASCCSMRHSVGLNLYPAASLEKWINRRTALGTKVIQERAGGFCDRVKWGGFHPGVDTLFTVIRMLQSAMKSDSLFIGVHRSTRIQLERGDDQARIGSL